MFNLKSILKDLKFQPPKWIPKNTGKRYYHRCIVVSHVNPDTECIFVFSSEEKAKRWKKDTEESVSHPEVIIDKIERPSKEGWML